MSEGISPEIRYRVLVRNADGQPMCARALRRDELAALHHFSEFTQGDPDFDGAERWEIQRGEFSKHAVFDIHGIIPGVTGGWSDWGWTTIRTSDQADREEAQKPSAKPPAFAARRTLEHKSQRWSILGSLAMLVAGYVLFLRALELASGTPATAGPADRARNVGSTLPAFEAPAEPARPL